MRLPRSGWVAYPVLQWWWSVHCERHALFYAGQREWREMLKAGIYVVGRANRRSLAPS